MKVISLVSRKGGSGKSTLATHLAVEALRSGMGTVVLMDLDPQGTAAAWFKTREADAPLLIESEPGQIQTGLDACREAGVDLVVIDTTPDLHRRAIQAARLSDFVLIPTRPSSPDMLAIGASVELVTSGGLRGGIIINQAPSGSSLTREARHELLAYNLPLCPVDVGMRIDFSRALITGQTAGEIKARGKAAQEIRKTWTWIQTQIGGIQ